MLQREMQKVKYAIEQKVCGFKSQNEKRLKRKEAC